MERESAMAELHQKIARAEAEEYKKHKQHLKAVAAARVEAEKKAKVLAAKKKQAEEEEKHRKKEIEKKALFSTEELELKSQEALQRREPAEPRLRAVPLGRRQRRDEQRTDGGGPDRWQRAEGEEGALGRAMLEAKEDQLRAMRLLLNGPRPRATITALPHAW